MDAGTSVLTRQTLVIDDRAWRWSGAKPWSLVTGGPEGQRGPRGGETPGPWRPHRQGRGQGPKASEASLDEWVAEQDLCSGPPFLLHKHLPQKVSA